MSTSAQPVREALRLRRSHSKLIGNAPTSAEIESLIEVMASIPDHSALRPWRVIELRGEARDRLGRALAKAAHAESPEKHIAKAQRAPLILAVVVSPRESEKVPAWEQEAVAAGVAHHLGLLLQEAGWGSIWRTGLLTRTEPVHEAHELAPHEYLMGWIYIGEIPERDAKAKPRKPIDMGQHFSSLSAE